MTRTIGPLYGLFRAPAEDSSSGAHRAKRWTLQTQRWGHRARRQIEEEEEEVENDEEGEEEEEDVEEQKEEEEKKL